MDRDNAVLELRFELEQETARAGRLERELLDSSNSSRGGEGKTGETLRLTGGSGSNSGGRSRREHDLENVVASLKQVASKLQAENERLSRAAAADGHG